MEDNLNPVPEVTETNPAQPEETAPQPEVAALPDELQAQIAGVFDSLPEAPAALDPAQCITIVTTTGDEQMVPVTGPISINDALAQAELPTDGQWGYYLNGANVPGDTLVGPGGKVVITRLTKGG